MLADGQDVDGIGVGLRGVDPLGTVRGEGELPRRAEIDKLDDNFRASLLEHREYRGAIESGAG